MAQLSFVKEVDQTLADEGDLLTYTLKPSWGAGNLLSNVVVEDTVPIGTTYAIGSANANGILDGNTVRWNLGSVLPGTGRFHFLDPSSLDEAANPLANLTQGIGGRQSDSPSAAAVDGNGITHVVFISTAQPFAFEGLPRGYLYYTNNSGAGGSWTTPLHINKKRSVDEDGPQFYPYAATPSIAIDAAGTIHVAYIDYASFDSAFNAYYLNIQNGNHTTPVVLSSNTHHVHDIDLTVDANGTIHVVYTDQPAGDTEDNVYYRNLAGTAQSWSTAQRISADGDGKQVTGPVIAAAPDGTIHIAWSDTTASHDSLYTPATATVPFYLSGTGNTLTDILDGEDPVAADDKTTASSPTIGVAPPFDGGLIANPGFESGSDESYANTDAWFNFAPDQVRNVRTTDYPFQGSYRGVIANTSAASDSAPAQDTGHSIVLGEQYTLSFMHAGALQWTVGTDQFTATLYYLDGTTPVDLHSATITPLQGKTDGYDQFQQTFPAITDQNAVGQSLHLRFASLAAANRFASIDNVSLSATNARSTLIANETGNKEAELKQSSSWGQTFSHTSGNSTYILNQIGLMLRKGGEMEELTVRVSLRSSWDGSELAHTSIPGNTLTNSFAWYEFDLGSVELADGTTYYIRIDGNEDTQQIYLEYSDQDSYPDGDLIKPDGKADTGKDLVFRIIGTDLPPAGPTTGIGIAGDSLLLTPHSRFWDGTTFSAAQAAPQIDADHSISAGASSPVRPESIMATVRADNADGRISLLKHDALRDSWSLLGLDIDSVPNSYQHFSGTVAYEQNSGDALFVYVKGSSDAKALRYMVDDGTTLTDHTDMTCPENGVGQNLHSASKPGSDEIMLVAANAENESFAMIWDGDAWDTGVVLTTSGDSYHHDINVAYEQESGRAMVVYGNTSNNVLYRLWDGTTWSNESTLTLPATAAGGLRWLTLNSSPGSNRLVLGAITNNGGMFTAVWNGSSWTDVIDTGGAAAIIDGVTRWPGIDAAFESGSGRAVAVYRTASPATTFAYRIWSDEAGWSDPHTGTNLAATADSIRLTADPRSDHLMASTMNANGEQNFTPWDGSAWGAATFAGTAFADAIAPQMFLFNQHQLPPSPPVAPTPPLPDTITFNQDAPLSEDLETPAGETLSVTTYVQIEGAIGETTTFSKRIATGNDDVEEEGAATVQTRPGFVYTSSTDIELVADTESPATGNQTVGFRFTGIDVPQGAVITNAYLTFRAIAPDSPMTNNEATNLLFEGEDVDSAGPFLNVDYNISSRTRTSAAVAWNSVPAWTTGEYYNTPDLSPILQELVDRTGWNATQDMAFIVTGTGSRSLAEYGTAPADAALLTVEYSVPTTTMPEAPAITATVLNDNTTVATLTDPAVTDLGSGIYRLDWSAPMPEATLFPAGSAVRLQLQTNEPALAFKVLYDSATYPSRLDLPVVPTNTSIRNIRLASGDGTTFGASTNISALFGGLRSEEPDLAIDSTGTAHLTWSDEFDGLDSNRNIYYANSNDWSGTRVRLSSNSEGGNAYSPTIAIDGSDAVHVAYTDQHSAAQEYENIYYTNTRLGPFAPRIDLTDDIHQASALTPQLSANGGRIDLTYRSTGLTGADDIFHLTADTTDAAPALRTTLTAEPTIVSDGEIIGVTLGLYSTSTHELVTPDAMPFTIPGPNGSTATLVALPDAQKVYAGNLTEFTWIYVISTANSLSPDQFSFTAGASDGATTWLPATSNSIIAAPPLTFQATVNIGAPTVITNTATISDDSGILNNSPSNTVVTQLAQPNSISGLVLQDTDGNGTGDSPLGGALLLLLDGNGNKVVNPITQEAFQAISSPIDGSFKFEPVPPGSYRIYESDPQGFTSVSDSDGENNNVIGDETPIVITDGHSSNGHIFIDTDNTITVGTNSIAGSVINDINGDGGLTGDPGIPGLLVELYIDSDGNGLADDGLAPIGTSITNGNGEYLFENLRNGKVVIVAADPEGAVSTNDVQGAPDDGQIALEMTGDQGWVNAIFLKTNIAYSTIETTVTSDTDGSGTITPADAPIGGVTIQLFRDLDLNGIADPNDPLIATAHTATDGTCNLPAVLNGAYVLVENDPVGATSITDSDGNGNGPNSIALTITEAGQTAGRFLDSNVVTHSVTGSVGTAGNMPILGVVITLATSDGTTIESTRTEADGTYAFSNLSIGEYLLIETNPPGTIDGKDSDGGDPDVIAVSLQDADSTNNLFMDVIPSLASISGTVYDDDQTNNNTIGPEDQPISGVRIDLVSDANANGFNDAGEPVISTTHTGYDGGYIFPNLVPGHYMVVEINPLGYSDADSDGPANGLDAIAVTLANVDSTANDFLDEGLSPQLILGSVSRAEGPIAGVTISLTTADGHLVEATTTNAAGEFSFPNVSPGDYLVLETDPVGTTGGSDADGSANGDNAIAVTVDYSTITGVDFVDVLDIGFLHDISGTLTDDANGNGPDPSDRPADGFEVTLFRDADKNGTGDGNEVVDTTTTNTLGEYSFQNLPDGNYIVTAESPSSGNDTGTGGGNMGLPPLIYIDLSGDDSPDNDLTAVIDPTGYFYDSVSGEIIPGGQIEVIASGAGTPTIIQSGITGQYSFIADGADTYTMLITPPDGYFVDPDRVVAAGTFDPTGYPDPYTLGSDENPDNPGFIIDPSAGANPYYLVFNLESGDPLVLNNNIPIRTISIRSYGQFVDDFELGTGPGAQPIPDAAGSGANPDGDFQSNLLEYALAEDPTTGASPNHGGFRIDLVDDTTGRIDVTFTRQIETRDLIYTLQIKDALTGTWTDFLTIPAGQAPPFPCIVTPNGDGTESVVYPDIANDPNSGLTPDLGFVRLQVSLDDDKDGSPDTLPGSATPVSDQTKTFGWQCTHFNAAQTASFSHPFSNPPVFSGIVDYTQGVAVNVETSSNQTDLSQIIGEGGSYYMQVTSGPLEGQRFDIESAGVIAINIVVDENIFSNTDEVMSLNTSNGLPSSADLAGHTIEVIPHLTVDQLFDKNAAFSGQASGIPSRAAKLFFYNNRSGVSGLEELLLVDLGTEQRWISSNDFAQLTDQGSMPVDRCSGAYIYPGLGPIPNQFALGMVADHDLAAVFNSGYNVAGAPYPIAQTPTGTNGRAMTVANGFAGGVNPTQSSEILFWMGDFAVDQNDSYVQGYDSYMQLNGAGMQRWIDVSDQQLTDLGSQLLLRNERSCIIKLSTGTQIVPHIYPAPVQP